ncbi:MAG: hypothetical protein O7G88_23340 [bacterium]|nr:hypothetical protein [bacterium]
MGRKTIFVVAMLVGLVGISSYLCAAIARPASSAFFVQLPAE